MKTVIECAAPSCTAEVKYWRRCPIKTCNQDIGYCPRHGGDDTSMAAVQLHIATEHATEPAHAGN